ncbi:MAG: DegV family protein [Dorea sp.]|jgi:DegV family protein with EDD domain|nr:DegV family protein [Dorea sp.]
MDKLVILAETGSDITKEVAEAYGIELVPMHVSFGSETKDDGTFPAEEIYGYYERTGTLPKTSGCVPEDFTKIFGEIREKYPESRILYLAYSAVTTCSYQSAQIAIDTGHVEGVTCVDTKQVSAGQYAVVVKMAKLLREHPEWTPEEAAKQAARLSGQVKMCFVPDTLEFLRAGGRVGNAAALAGSLLKLHPCIEILDGYLQATKKFRGNMGKIAPKLVKEYIAGQKLSLDEIYLIWAPGLLSDTMKAAEKAAYECGVKKITWVQTGGVITCHGGPGAFGIVGFSQQI